MIRSILPVLLLATISICQATTKVAVLGDSISTGAHAEPRKFNGYPARMGHLLGEDYEVRAFAISGHTLLRKTSASLMNKPIYKEALKYAPDVAVIMLGTNDSSSKKRPFWQHHADLEPDLKVMISDLRKSNAKVMIHLAGPPPMYPEKKGLAADRVSDLTERREHLKKVREVFRKVAADEPRVVIHDLERVLSAEETSDGVHPGNFGHENLANFLTEVIGLSYDEGFSFKQASKEKQIELRSGDFHGFEKFDFQSGDGNLKCAVVSPRQAAKGQPWIWRARFFGHQPGLDLELLDRGWHVAYCDVSNLYGADDAMKRWEGFYRGLTGLGLSKKPVMEGMSRGGLPIFRWASLHPGKVSAVYGDNPVCDFRSWPGGHGGKRSEGDWAGVLKAWSVSEEEAMNHDQVVDWLESVAKAKVPVALVLGSADDVVPPVNNGEKVASRYAELGGPVTVWRKPGKGHHPHGLHPPGALRRYLMSAAGFGRNPAEIASPSSEYRSGAGWGNGGWVGAWAHLKKTVAANPDSEIVFLGDSITQGLTGHGDRVAKSGGGRAIDKYYGDRKALSLGLSGDRTEHLIWRTLNGQFDGLKPDWVVVMIGVNNINAAGHTGEEVAAGTRKLLAVLMKTLPSTKVLLLGSFPPGKMPEVPRREDTKTLHEGIAPLADGKRVFYRDLSPLFLDENGVHNGLMSGDGIHINGAGKEVWMKAIQDQLGK